MTDVRIISEELGGSPLSQSIQRGDAPPNWVPPQPRSADAWRATVAERVQEVGWADRLRRLAPAIAASGTAAERLERVMREGGVVVTTGQQPGLFGGPVYTWSKAMGAIAVADALERATGIPVAPLFWAATDDADFAEASYTVLARSGGAEVLRATNAPPAGTPMALAPLGDMSAMLASLRAATGSSADPRPLALVEAAYGDPSRSVGDAYVSLLRALLEPLGMPVIDASHPAVRTESDATLRDALRNAEAIELALDARRAEIVAAGYEPQVEDVAGLSLVFIRENGIKRRVSVKEAAAVADDQSAILTPNVLLRAVVERAILPTVAYLGGPGELGYFAQVSAVAQARGVREPLSLPRWSCTLVEPHVAALLDKLGIDIGALRQPYELEGALARAAMSADSAETIAALRRAIAVLPGGLGHEAAPLGLTAAVQGAVNSLNHRVDRLERRLVAGIKRREHLLLSDVATLRAALFPSGTRQERALNLIPTLSRHGWGLLGEMRDAATGHAGTVVGAVPATAAKSQAPVTMRS